MSGFLGGSVFLRGMTKTKKDTKFKTEQQKWKEEHKMQTTTPLSPFFEEKKDNTDTK